MSDQNPTPGLSAESASQAADQQPSANRQQPGVTQQSARDPRQSGNQRHGGRRRPGGGFGQHAAGEARRSETGEVSSVNLTELRELVELIATHGFTDFELEREGFRVRLRREQPAQIVQGQSSPLVYPASPAVMQPAPAQTQQPAPQQPAPETIEPVAPAATASAPAASSDADLHTITSPIVGTFYRSPSPTADAFVKVGSTVEADTVVCIVEAMKLMNEILAETSGTIEKIYVENAQPVEFGQPLFGVRK